MKLLKRPTSITQEHRIGARPARTEVRFNPLGLLGIGPIATMVDRPATEGTVFAGRSILQPVEIDFEKDDPIPTCLIEDAPFDCWRKRREPVKIKCEEDGWVYILHGLFPMDHLRANVWHCIIDHFER